MEGNCLKAFLEKADATLIIFVLSLTKTVKWDC
jgi:hypothetical protein